MKVKMVAIIMILTFLVMSLSACSKGTKEQNKDNSSDKEVIEQKVDTQTVASMGRYMEKEIELPKLEGNEAIIKILQNAEKQFEVYTVNPTNTGNEIYCYREAENMSWEKSTPQWLNTSNLLDKMIVLIDVSLGGDGRYYAIFNKYGETTKSMVFRADQADSAQSIDIAYLEEPVQNIKGKEYYPSIQRIGVLKNGNIVLRDMWNENALLVFDSQGEKVDEISTGMAQRYIIYENYVVTMNEEGKVILYNSETKNIDKSLEYSVDGGDSFKQMTYVIKKDGTLLLGDSKGIHRLPEDGTLWETTVDGALNSMSMPSLTLNALFIKEGEQEEYYLVYSDDKGYKLKKYEFNKNVSAAPEKEITVYSLVENSTIRQAISLFQSQNTNVKVNYVVAMSEEGSVIDYIRALNTELLSGNGADILVLDDLPVESYIEKGILADISDIVNPLKSSGELLENIQANYLKDGKVYQLPIRFSVPIIIGNKDALSSSESLEATVEYIRNNKEVPYAAPSTNEQLLKDYLALNMDNIFLDGKLQKEQLASFLSNLKEISDNVITSENDYYSSGEVTFSKGGGITVKRNSDNLFQGMIIGAGSKYAAAMLQINNIMDLMVPSTFLKNTDIEYNTLGDRFIPKGLIGLNSTSKEGELAKQFIQYLFTKEIQDTNLYDGLPVLLPSLQNWFNEDNQDIKMGLNDSDGNMIVATWPEKESREEFLNKILTVKKPIVCNQIIIDMIKEHALLYLTGTEDIEKATNSISTKVDTYLAE